MNILKLIFGLTILILIPVSFLVVSLDILGCFSSYSVSNASFYSFYSERYEGCGSNDDLTTTTFEIEGFWVFYGYDDFEIPEFDKAFDDDYEIDGVNLYAAYMWMWFAFIGLIAYCILQFFATSNGIISISSDIIMLFVGVASLMEYLVFRDNYKDMSEFADDYMYIPVMTIVCVLLGLYGIGRTVQSRSEEEEYL